MSEGVFDVIGHAFLCGGRGVPAKSQRRKGTLVDGRVSARVTEILVFLPGGAIKTEN